MKLLVMKFRVNDLDSSYGKQIEFNAGIVKEFFEFTNDTENIEFVYKSFKGDAVNDNMHIKASLGKSPARGDYKIYTNADGSLFLKQFFLVNLNLSLDNIDDFFTIKKLGNNKYEVSYIPSDSELGRYFSTQGLAGQIVDITDEKQNAEKIDKPHNRIIFGAPGTGKSHRLNKDSSVFNIYTDIKDTVIKAIENTPKENQVAYHTSLGIKYVNFLQNFVKDSKNQKEKLYDLMGENPNKDNISDRLQNGMNIVKFISINMRGDESVNKNIERVTFHPNYSYAQFVGTYKPVQDSVDETQIKYEYVPGPFLRTFIKAKKTRQNVLLIIEEINRANVAAVFGDVFQLLDRKSDGTSEYPITTSEDLRKFLARPENLDGKPEDYETISIPSNMYIWATMNSADQGVFPMDTAFKRRWEFEYIGIDDGVGEIEGVTIPVPNGTKKENDKIITNYVHVEWNKLRVAINDQLKKVSGVNEDKLLGPFFIGDKTKIESAAKNPEQFCKSFKSKVLMYLFEDVVKMQPGELFESKEGTNIHYSDICKDFDSKGLKIFIKSIYEQFPEVTGGDSE